MTTSQLFRVLAPDSKDTAGCILHLLPLAALGALACTCRGMRALVTDATHAWQAAAGAEFSSGHPIHASSSVRAYLAQQHAIQAAISQGSCRPVQQVLAQDRKWSALSCNCSKLVHLIHGKQLVMVDTLHVDVHP